MSSKIQTPYPLFSDIDGHPLDAGFIYIGEAGKNPEVYPIPVFWDEDLSIPAAQPIRTRNGYLSYYGRAGKLYVSSDQCSITVRNKKRSLIYTDLYADLAFTQTNFAEKIKNFTIYVNSISDLLNLEKWEGRTAYAKSFYSNINFGEGGDLFIYRSARQMENDGVSIFNGWERQKNGMPYSPEDAGAKHDGVTDDAPCFVKLFNLAKVKPTGISLSPNATYVIDTDILVEDVKSISFLANGATYKVTNSSDRNQMYPFTLVGTTDGKSCIFVDDFKQDCSAVFVDQSTITREYYVCGFRLWNMSVFMRGIQQNKLQGYAFQFLRCKNVVVDGYIGNDVGGNNSNAGLDSMGDIFYIGDRIGESNYEFKNVTVNGVVQGGLNSRALVVCEILVPANNVDTVTNVTLTNVTAKNFMRTVHNETAHGSISISINNSDIRETSILGFSLGVAGGSKIDVNNSYIELNNFQYGGTNSLNKQCEINVNAGSIINGINAPRALLIQDTTLGKTYINSGAKVINVKSQLGEYGEILAEHSEFKFSESYSSYYLFGAKITCSNCDLLNTENTQIKIVGTVQNNFTLKGCTVKNLSFDRSVYQSCASKIFMNSSLTGYDKKLTEARYADIYINDVLYSKYGQTQPVKSTTLFTSYDDLVWESKYWVEGAALTNPPFGSAPCIVETTLLDYIPSDQNLLMHTATNYTTKATVRRTRDYLGVWSSWS